MPSPSLLYSLISPLWTRTAFLVIAEVPDRFLRSLWIWPCLPGRTAQTPVPDSLPGCRRLNPLPSHKNICGRHLKTLSPIRRPGYTPLFFSIRLESARVSFTSSISAISTGRKDSRIQLNVPLPCNRFQPLHDHLQQFIDIDAGNLQLSSFLSSLTRDKRSDMITFSPGRSQPQYHS